MAAADNRYSRFVAWVRILLPLAALALLASLFLVARTPVGTPNLPFTDLSLDELARAQRLNNPTFTGLTDDGRAITARAKTAWPHVIDSKRMDAIELWAELEIGNDGVMTITSDRGQLNTNENTAVLSGDVVVTTSDGYRLETEELTAALNSNEMETSGAVSGSGPGFTLDAGRMQIAPNPDAQGEVLVVFKDGVKLIYTPQN